MKRIKRKITKAIIPAAGFGTRFLPATKSMPKEMLPIVDKPIIQYVVEEAVASGIKDIIIVTGWHKRSIEDYFDYPYELEKRLEEAGKSKELEEVRRIAEMANFIYVRQKGPYGNATPVYCCRHLIDDDEDVAVLWGDEFIYSNPPRLSQMMKVYEELGGAVISAVRVDQEDVSRYGIADVEPVSGNIHRIKKIVEKPALGKAPSDLATHGAYILPGEIFPILQNLKPGKGGELWLPEAIDKLIQSGFPVYACEIKNGRYYDTGNKLEYLKANIDFALQRPDLKEGLKKYLKTICEK
ncbi:MAG TPA: UTP--glucose-1-phosphate uridylyltransferase [Candidatus Magasanikbacteria bacterium]|nr:UTP--glucose-1-phosphate uridylyltransferase [Candidatus Magasanikbacteria bacterium]